MKVFAFFLVLFALSTAQKVEASNDLTVVTQVFQGFVEGFDISVDISEVEPCIQDASDIIVQLEQLVKNIE